MLEEESPLSLGNFVVSRSEEVDDALLFGNEGEESDGLLENETLFRENGFDSENDALDEDLLCSDCMTVEALDMEEEDWFREGDYASIGANAGGRNVHSDSESEILFEDDEELLLDAVVANQERNTSTHPMLQADYDEMLMSDDQKDFLQQSSNTE